MSDDTTAVLRAGAAEAMITPCATGTWLLGPMEPSKGVHEDLFARALAIDDGRQCLVIVTMDLSGLDVDIVETIRAQVESETGIPGNAVMINCSHTHSSPCTLPYYIMGWQECIVGEWYQELPGRIIEVIKQALANMLPATLAYGREPVQIGFNRRYKTAKRALTISNPVGVVLPWVDVLRVDGADGKPRAVLLSHAAHPTNSGAWPYISADYPAYAVTEVKEALGEQVIGMFAQGCGGNIIAEPLGGSYKAAGRLLGSAAVRAVEDSQTLEVTSLRCHSMVLQLPFDDLPSLEKVEKLLAIYERDCEIVKSKPNPSKSESWYLPNYVYVAKDLIKKIKEGTLSDSLKFEIQAFAFGDEFCLVGMTHEMFAEYQMAACDMSPFKHNMVLGYTNGIEQYIPCDDDYGSGFLDAGPFPEPRSDPYPAPGSGLAFKHRRYLRQGIEKQILAGLMEMLDQLRPPSNNASFSE